VKENNKVVLHVVYIDYRTWLAAGELRPSSDVGGMLGGKKRLASA
jgi:hypothetical protein